MSDRERDNFIKGAASRGPGKRQIKPSLALFTGSIIDSNQEGEDDDYDTEDTNSLRTISSTSESDSNESEDESGEYKNMENEENISNAYHVNEREETQHKPNAILPSQEDSLKVLFTDVNEFICAVCLNIKTKGSCGEIIQCDRCGLTVHDVCYGFTVEHEETQSQVSSASTEPWFCDPCVFGESHIPHCELCPSRIGAFKKTDINGSWVHLICASHTPGINFLNPEELSGIIWSEMDFRTFGRKKCVGCLDELESRTGITVRCDAGLCKNYYHITCAQRLGLLVNPDCLDNEHNQMHKRQHAEAGYINCMRHNQNEAVIVSLRNAYNKFMKQEDRRMMNYRNKQIVMGPRQERKRRHQMNIYLGNSSHCQQDDLISQPSKRLKLLHTSAKYLNAFVEKADLLGMSRKQFLEELKMVPTAQLPSNLPPAFSNTFFNYVKYRDTDCAFEEEKRLKKVFQEKNTLLDRQVAIEQEIQKKRRKLHFLQDKKEDTKKYSEKLKGLTVDLSQSSHNHNIWRRKSQINLDRAEVTDLEGIYKKCQKCNEMSDPHLQAFCETCKHYYHIGCLDPPLNRIPPKNKFSRFECSNCAFPSDDEEGNEDSNDTNNRLELSNEWTLTGSRIRRHNRVRQEMTSF